jgi:hypothetical protein
MRNFRFILSNLYFWLKKTNLSIGDEPFMPSLEKEVFKSLVRKSNHLLEYGGGGSTVWSNGIGKIVTCVENNVDWINFIREKVSSKGTPENLRLLIADSGLTGAFGMPALGNWTPGLVGKGLEYVIKPFILLNEENNYDLVFVDGRWRVSCCLFSALMLPLGVPILLDDFESNRRYELLYTFFEIEVYGRLACLKLKRDVNRDQLIRAFVNSLKDAE